MACPPVVIDRENDRVGRLPSGRFSSCEGRELVENALSALVRAYVVSRQKRWHHSGMKHGRLCAIGHNLADSMASGLAFVIGYHPMDVFAEAASSPGGVIEVDFLKGGIVRGKASENLKTAAARFAEVLPVFCQENGAEAADFVSLSAAFDATALERRMLLVVTDRNGYSSTTEYAGIPLKRVRVLDSLVRIRRTPRQTGARSNEAAGIRSMP